MQKLRIVTLGLGTAELLLRRYPLYGDAGVPMLEVRAPPRQRSSVEALRFPAERRLPPLQVSRGEEDKLAYPAAARFERTNLASA